MRVSAMFDPIPLARLVAMLGELLRESARWDRPLDEFRTSQLLSASSVARYLSAELAGLEPHRRRFADGATALVERTYAAATEPGWRAALNRAREVLVTEEPLLGEATSAVLRAARASPDPTAQPFAVELRGLLAAVADRHVEVLAGEIR
jgi:hypothetical protein